MKTKEYKLRKEQGTIPSNLIPRHKRKEKKVLLDQEVEKVLKENHNKNSEISNNTGIESKYVRYVSPHFDNGQIISTESNKELKPLYQSTIQPFKKNLSQDMAATTPLRSYSNT